MIDARFVKLFAISTRQFLHELPQELKNAPANEGVVGQELKSIFTEMAGKIVADLPSELSDSPNFFTGALVGIQIGVGVITSQAMGDISNAAKILEQVTQQPVPDARSLALVCLLEEVLKTRDKLMEAAAQMGVKLED